MKRRAAAPEAVTPRAPLLIVGCLVVLGTVHVAADGGPPAWTAVALAAAGLWRLACLRLGRLPPRWVLLPLAGAGAPLVWAGTGYGLAREFFVGMLVLLCGLKLLEVRTRRDWYVAAFLGLFLAMAAFLVSQTPLMAAGMLACVAGLSAALVALADATGGGDVRRDLRTAGVLLLQGTPLALAAFLFFPRIQGQLWAMNVEPARSLTGLSERMDLGSVNSLALSEEVAFRVSFPDGLPTGPLYWRGPVFEGTSGPSWFVAGGEGAGSFAPPWPDDGLGAPAEPIPQEVTLEPHGKRWLFALDLPLRVAPPGVVVAGREVRAHRPVRSRLRYSAESVPHPGSGELPAERRARLLQAPPVTERVRGLAEEWRQAKGPAGAVAAALLFFREQPFVYTLSPAALGPDPVDRFLFETREGFCEHFAGSFALLMRLSGVPSRVVTGYLGAEPNPLGEYWVVRQSHAHAWAEVWLAGRGWVRVDPTAAVAPERVDRSIQVTAGALTGGVRYVVPADGWLGRGGRTLAELWDSAHNAWNHWVIDYGAQRQGDLLRRLGFARPSRDLLVGLLAFACSLAVLVMALQVFRGGVAARDPVQRAYVRFCRKMARAGVSRSPHEGPRAYAARIVRERPGLRGDAEAVVGAYIELRYEGRWGEEARRRRARQLAARVRKVRVERWARTSGGVGNGRRESAEHL